LSSLLEGQRHRLAADQGLDSAQTNLGLMYYSGSGVPKDLVQTHVWFNIAGAAGHESAKRNLAIVEKEMTDTQKEKAMDLARELFAKLPKTK
jgi:TPR repeat protein